MAAALIDGAFIPARGRHRAPRVPLTERVVDGVVSGVTTAVPSVTPAVSVGVITVGTVLGGAAAASAVPISHTNTTTNGSSQTTFRLPTNAPYAAPTALDLKKLRGCESGGNYSINTGNGYYGAYQFNAGTWQGLGLSGLPSQASPALQDAAASSLEMERGWSPWPACSASLGLTSHKSTGSAAPTLIVTDFSASASAPSSKATSTPKVAVPRGAVPAFSGKVITTALSGTYRSDVQLWQQRMAQRGWDITADGYFGPQSASVAKNFAVEKGLHPGLPGEVDGSVWKAAWSTPVT